MPRRLSILAVSIVFFSGCIFGGGSRPKDDNNGNGETNGASTNGGTNEGGTNGSTNNAIPDETYGDLNAADVACPNPRTAWFAPDDADPPLTENSSVATAEAPTDQGGSVVGGEPVGDVSIAYATADETGISVYAAAGELGSETGEITPVLSGSRTFDAEDADVYSVALTSGGFKTTEEERGNVLTVTVSTSEGIYECLLTVDDAGQTEMACGSSPYSDLLAQKGLDAPARVDIAPIFSEHRVANGFEWGFDVLSSDYVVTASQPLPEGGERVAALVARDDGDVELVDVSDALPGETDSMFAERVLFGVPESSFGFPFLAALAPGPDPESRPKPILMRSDTLNGTSYTRVAGLEDWRLSSRIEVERGAFTFVDQYVAEVSYSLLNPTGLRIVPGELNLGYVGLDSSGLVFSRPEGFGGNDYLEFALEGATEVAAFKNLSISTGNGPAAVAVIHGDDQDEIAVFRWQLQLDADWVEDLLAPGFSRARRMSPVWFFDDAGTIPFVAMRDGGWVLAAVRVPNLRDLSEGCQ